MKWTFKINNSVDRNLGRFYNGNNILGMIEFFELRDFLQFLAILPRNKIKIEGWQILKLRGVPLELTEYGALSITNTVRELNKVGYTPVQISNLTGIDEQRISQYVSRMK